MYLYGKKSMDGVENVHLKKTGINLHFVVNDPKQKNII